ncbi:MAG: hypothetical protein M3A44_08030 [Gammaproteobacteria bacterium]
MHSAIPKSLLYPPKLTFPEVRLPEVLPTGDDAAWTALLHAQQAAHLAAQHAAIDSFESQVRDYVNRLVEQMILARHRQFGVSSEKISGQGRWFDEAEVLAAESTPRRKTSRRFHPRLRFQTQARTCPQLRRAASGRRCRPSCRASRSYTI